MRLARGPTTTNSHLQGVLWVFLVLLAEGLGGVGCGRTTMGNQPTSRVDGTPSQVQKPDGGPDDRPTHSGSGTGGSAGASPKAGGSVGLGGRGAGGAGIDAMRADEAVTGSTGIVGAGGAARGTGGASTGDRGAGGTMARPLWRDSYDKFCPMLDTQSVFVDVWSDDRGVFVLTSDYQSHPAIWSNLGTSWQNTFSWPEENHPPNQGGLKGFTGGPLIAYGGFPCGIQFISGGGAECSGAADFVADLSVVNASLAYAVNYNRVLQFDGNFWTQLGDPLPGVAWGNAVAVWADSSTVVVAARPNYSVGLVFKIESGGVPVLLPGLPSQIDPIALWSFGASDIWAGGTLGQLVHYDGVKWSHLTSIPYNGAVSKSVSSASGIGKIKLWGSSGRLFAIAGNIFGQWDGTRFKILDSLNGEAYFAGLWGNSPTEVFVAVHDRQNSADRCGPFQVRWFNGSAVGPL